MSYYLSKEYISNKGVCMRAVRLSIPRCGVKLLLSLSSIRIVGLAIFMSCLVCCGPLVDHCSDFPTGYEKEVISLSKVTLSSGSKMSYLDEVRSIRRCAIFTERSNDKENLIYLGVSSDSKRRYLTFKPMYVTDRYILFQLSSGGKIVHAYKAYI